MATKTTAESAKDPSPKQTIDSRRRNACSNNFFYRYVYRRRGGLPTEDELDVAKFLVMEDFRRRWTSASTSDDVLVAAATMVQMKKDPKYSAPVQKVSCPKCNQTRRDPRT